MSSLNIVAQSQVETVEQELARLRQENAKLKGEKPTGFKITDKGGLSVYGLGRFPVTLYKSQWIKLIGMAETIKSFIETNNDKLSDKAKAEVTAKVDVA